MSNQHTNLKKINIELLCLMLEYGVKRLVENYRYIDELNVFPVPDGDTGTNMKITVETGYEAIKKQSFEDIFLLGKTFTRNLLLGARGNSGVITSQIFKGFFKYIPEQTKEIDISMLVMCFAGAKETSYKAVITPVEGTMLTIIRVVSEMLCKDEKKIDNIEQMFEKIVNIAEQTLIKTPELLPELKEAGVVDSGAYGVCRIFEGMKYAINLYTGTVNSAKPTSSSNEIQETKSSSNEFVDNNEGFGYCNEFIMTIGSRVEASQKQKEKFDEHKFKKQLEKMGESIVFVRDEELVKVHIHTPSPWKVFEYASNFGEFNKVKVENMTLQYLEKNPGLTLQELFARSNPSSKPHEDIEINNTSDITKIIVTTPDNKTAELFEDKFDIKNVIKTNIVGNPSVTNFLKQIKATNSKKIIILLDDSNYFMSAEQTKKMLPKEINVEIIVTKNIAISYYLCLLFNSKISYEKNIKIMLSGFKKSESILISTAAKEGIFNKVKVRKNDFFVIFNKKIIKAGDNLFEISNSAFSFSIGKRKIRDIYLFAGDNAGDGEVKKISEFIEKTYKIKPNVFHTDIQNYPLSIAFIK